MSCHSTRIELFYFDDNFRRIAQWVRPLKGGAMEIMVEAWSMVEVKGCTHRAMVLCDEGIHSCLIS